MSAGDVENRRRNTGSLTNLQMEIKSGSFRKSPLTKPANEDTLRDGGIMLHLHMQREILFTPHEYQTNSRLDKKIQKDKLLEFDSKYQQITAVTSQ